MSDKEIDAIEFREDLNYDKLRHKLLGILIRQRVNVEIYHKEKNIVLGVDYDYLRKELNITKEELFIVASKLREESEVELYDMNFKGYFVKTKAVESYISKKYIKNPRNEKRETVKYYVQTTIPVISLIIAFLAITLNILQWKSNKTQSELILKLNKESEQVNIRLDYLERKTKNRDNVLSKNQ